MSGLHGRRHGGIERRPCHLPDRPCCSPLLLRPRRPSGRMPKPARCAGTGSCDRRPCSSTKNAPASICRNFTERCHFASSPSAGAAKSATPKPGIGKAATSRHFYQVSEVLRRLSPSADEATPRLTIMTSMRSCAGSLTTRASCDSTSRQPGRRATRTPAPRLQPGSHAGSVPPANPAVNTTSPPTAFQPPAWPSSPAHLPSAHGTRRKPTGRPPSPSRPSAGRPRRRRRRRQRPRGTTLLPRRRS